MKRVLAATISTAVLFLALVAFMTSKSPVTKRTATVWADEGPCSLAGIVGTYGFSDSGTVVGVGPRVADALLTLDADRNIKGPATASLNGTVTHSMLSGTYTVNADCTGTVTFSEPGNVMLTATADLIWDDNMREIRFIFTSAAANGTPIETVINGTARKISPNSGN